MDQRGSARGVYCPGLFPFTRAIARMPPLINLTGKKIAGITIKRRAGTSEHGHTLWQGECDQCKGLVTKAVSDLRAFERRGSTNVCGCIARQGLVGQTFGKITVTTKLSPRRLPSGQFMQMYEGTCECGETVVRSYSNMQISKACRECVAQSKVIDLTGQIKGRLRVLYREGSDKHGRAIWICRCTCPEKTVVPVTSRELLRGDTESCGCWHDESASIRAVHRIRTSKYAQWNCPFFRKKKKIARMKRTWEVMFARYLDLKGWKWIYEPPAFKLPSERRYIPDFEVAVGKRRIFFDVKGWKKPESMEKIEEFSKRYKIFVIDRGELIRLTGMRPERFKQLYDVCDTWAYHGVGSSPWSTLRNPTGLR